MDIYEKYIKILPEFYETKVDEQNFNEIVFGILSKIFEIDEAYIFFLNSDTLTLKYSYCSKLKSSEISLKVFNDISAGVNCLFTDLYIEKCPFAKLLIILKQIPTTQEKFIFYSAASVVGNLLKNAELTGILKMQVEALQDGIDEVNKTYFTVKEQNEKILASEKIKNEFFANVSHELRTPLNSIIGFSDMLSQEFVGKLNSQQAEYVKDIKIAGVNLLGMINEILDMSKIEAHSVKLFKSSFLLKQNIVEVLNILQPLYIQKEISVKTLIPEDFIVNADYQKLQQVFFNLISNAIKFTPKGGRIVISSSINGHYSTISVKDNGCGIAKKNQKKIFKKFVQIEPCRSASTGLGLTIVREIISLHSGNVSVISDGYSGSEFLISLPLS